VLLGNFLDRKFTWLEGGKSYWRYRQHDLFSVQTITLIFLVILCPCNCCKSKNVRSQGYGWNRVGAWWLIVAGWDVIFLAFFWLFEIINFWLFWRTIYWGRFSKIIRGWWMNDWWSLREFSKSRINPKNNDHLRHAIQNINLILITPISMNLTQIDQKTDQSLNSQRNELIFASFPIKNNNNRKSANEKKYL
jgi:hypothetical protein